MSEDNESNDEMKNLTNIDFKNKKERLQTPHSKLALLKLGMDEEKLVEITKEQYLLMHPELKDASNEIQDKRYKHYNKRREEKIEKAKKLRNELIEDEKKEKEENGDTDSDDLNKTKKKKFESAAIKKEKEKLEVMKKQQLGEIRNIIDYAYKTEEVKKKMMKKLNYKKKKKKN